MERYIIYKITNNFNNKVYIGSTVNSAARWRVHKHYAKNEDKGTVIHRAMRNCLTDGAKKGMGYCWFYKTEENEQFYYDKAIALLGSFKTNFAAPIKMTSIKTGQVTILTNIYEAKIYGFLPKEINRVLTGSRKACRGYSFELAS